MTLSTQKTPKSSNWPLFRVDFFGGFSVTGKAPNSIKAEQMACRKHPGIVQKVRILKGKPT